MFKIKIKTPEWRHFTIVDFKQVNITLEVPSRQLHVQSQQ